MRRLARAALGVVGLSVGILAVIALREATLSTHQPVDPDSRVELVLEVETRNRERGQTPAELVEALVLTCRLEVSSDVVGEVEHQVGDLYRAVLQPALDETDRRQFRGCLEDWTIDQLVVDVVSFDEVSLPSER